MEGNKEGEDIIVRKRRRLEEGKKEKEIVATRGRNYPRQ